MLDKCSRMILAASCAACVLYGSYRAADGDVIKGRCREGRCDTLVGSYIGQDEAGEELCGDCANFTNTDVVRGCDHQYYLTCTMRDAVNTSRCIGRCRSFGTPCYFAVPYCKN